MEIKNYQKFNEGLFTKWKNEIRDRRIKSICKKYDITHIDINEDGSIDCLSINATRLSHRELSKLPLKFNTQHSSFVCNNNNLTTLEGSPSWVGGDFNCYFNQLTSLEGSPSYVGGNFRCFSNQITSFEGFPNHVGGEFVCYNNPISEVWNLFYDKTKIELFNDYDIIRPDKVIILERLNDFLKEIGKFTETMSISDTISYRLKIVGYKCI